MILRESLVTLMVVVTLTWSQVKASVLISRRPHDRMMQSEEADDAGNSGVTWAFLQRLRRPRGIQDDLRRHRSAVGGLERPPGGVFDHLSGPQGFNGGLRRPLGGLGDVENPDDVFYDQTKHQNGLRRPETVITDLGPFGTNGDLTRPWGLDGGTSPQGGKGNLERPRGDPSGWTRQDKQWWYALNPGLWFDPRYASNHRWGDESAANTFSYTTPSTFSRRTFVSSLNNTHDDNNHVRNDKDISKYDNLGSINYFAYRAPQQTKNRSPTHPSKPQSTLLDRTSFLSADMLGQPYGHLSLLVSVLTILFMIFSAVGADTSPPGDLAEVTARYQPSDLDVTERVQELLLPRDATVTSLTDIPPWNEDREIRPRRSLPQDHENQEANGFVGEETRNRTVIHVVSDFRTVEPIYTGGFRIHVVNTSIKGNHFVSDVKTEESSGIPVDDHGMSDTQTDDNKTSEFRTQDYSVGRKSNSLREIALSAAMLLGAYVGYVFRPMSSGKTINAKRKVQRGVNKTGTPIIRVAENPMGDEADDSIVINPVPASIDLSSLSLENLMNLTLPSKNKLTTDQSASDEDENADPQSHLLGAVKPPGTPAVPSTHLYGSVWDPQTTQVSATASYFATPQLSLPDHSYSPVAMSTLNAFPDTNVLLHGPSDDVASVPTILVVQNLRPHLITIAASISSVKPTDIISVVMGDGQLLPIDTVSHAYISTYQPDVPHSQHIGTQYPDMHENDKRPSTYWTVISKPYLPEEPSLEGVPIIEGSGIYQKPSTPKPHLTEGSGIYQKSSTPKPHLTEGSGIYQKPSTPKPHLTEGSGIYQKSSTPKPHLTEGSGIYQKSSTPKPHLTEGSGIYQKPSTPKPHLTEGSGIYQKSSTPKPHLTEGSGIYQKSSTPKPHLTEGSGIYQKSSTPKPHLTEGSGIYQKPSTPKPQVNYQLILNSFATRPNVNIPEESNLQGHPALKASGIYQKSSTPKPQGNYQLISSSFPVRPAGNTGTYGSPSSAQNQSEDDDYEYYPNYDFDVVRDERPGAPLVLPGQVLGRPNFESVLPGRFPSPSYYMTPEYRPNTQVHVQPIKAGLTKDHSSQVSTKDVVALSVTEQQPSSGDKVLQEDKISSFEINHKFPEHQFQHNYYSTDQPQHQDDYSHSDYFEYDVSDDVDAQTFDTLVKLAQQELVSLQGQHKNLQQYEVSNTERRESIGSGPLDQQDTETLNVEEDEFSHNYPRFPSVYSPGQAQGEESSTSGNVQEGGQGDTSLPVELLHHDTLTKLDNFLEKLLANLNSTIPLDKLMIPETLIPDVVKDSFKISGHKHVAEESRENNMLVKIFSKLSSWKNKLTTVDLDTSSTDGDQQNSADPTKSVSRDSEGVRTQTLFRPQQVSRYGNNYRSKITGGMLLRDLEQTDHLPSDGLRKGILEPPPPQQHLKHEVTTAAGRLSTWSFISDNSESSSKADPNNRLQTTESTSINIGPQNSLSPSLDVHAGNSERTFSPAISTYQVAPYVETSTYSQSEVSTPNSVSKTHSGVSGEWTSSSKYRVEVSSSMARNPSLPAQGSKKIQQIQRRSSLGTQLVSDGHSFVSSEKKNALSSAADMSDTFSRTPSENISKYLHFSAVEHSTLTPTPVYGNTVDPFIFKDEISPTSKLLAGLSQSSLRMSTGNKHTENTSKKPTFGFGLELARPPAHYLSSSHKLPTYVPSRLTFPTIVSQDSQDFLSFYHPDSPRFATPLTSTSGPSIPSSQPGAPLMSFHHSSAPHPPYLKSSKQTFSITPPYVNKKYNSSSSRESSPSLRVSTVTSHFKSFSSNTTRNPTSLPSVQQDVYSSAPRIPSEDGLDGFSSASFTEDSTDTLSSTASSKASSKDSQGFEPNLMSRFLCRHAVYHNACAVCMQEVGHRTECLVRSP
nr:uncharacterized protein LOC128697970 [Cherax quadricarinatus]